jgi:hypothetical protein
VAISHQHSSLHVSPHICAGYAHPAFTCERQQFSRSVEGPTSSKSVTVKRSADNVALEPVAIGPKLRIEQGIHPGKRRKTVTCTSP